MHASLSSAYASADVVASVLRNKFCYTLTLVFLRLYPTPSPDFLKPFLAFLDIPTSSASTNTLQTTLLTLHLLCEIASEVHDPLLKSARSFAGDRNKRDGMVRDSLRATGDTEAVIKGTLALVEKGMNVAGQPLFEEAVEWGLRTLAAWARKHLLDSVTAHTLRVSFDSLGRHFHVGHTAVSRALSAARQSFFSRVPKCRSQHLQHITFERDKNSPGKDTHHVCLECHGFHSHTGTEQSSGGKV